MFPLPPGVVISQRNPGFPKKHQTAYQPPGVEGLWFLGTLLYFPKHAVRFLISVSLNLDLGALLYIYT